MENVIEGQEGFVFEKVILIDENGNNLGEIDSKEALRRAKSVNLDLVIVQHDETLPVCKIQDQKKIEYKKKVSLRRNKSKEVKTKEIRINSEIAKHDLEVKVSHINGFLEKGDNVKVVIKSMSRRAKTEIKKCIEDISKKIFGSISQKFQIENEASESTNQYSFFIVPVKK